jgi:hypothetical protein
MQMSFVSLRCLDYSSSLSHGTNSVDRRLMLQFLRQASSRRLTMSGTGTAHQRLGYCGKSLRQGFRSNRLTINVDRKGRHEAHVLSGTEPGSIDSVSCAGVACSIRPKRPPAVRPANSGNTPSHAQSHLGSSPGPGAKRAKNANCVSAVRYRAAASHTRARAAPDTATPRDTLSPQYKTNNLCYFLETFYAIVLVAIFPCPLRTARPRDVFPFNLYPQSRHVPISPHS